MHKNKLLFGFTSFTILISSLVFGFCSKGFAEDKIIAIVNNDIITQKDLNDFVNFMRVQLSREFKDKQLDNKIQSMKSDLLDRLIEDRLILQEAKKSDIKLDNDRVKDKIAEMKKHYKTDADFEKALAQQGMVAADVENRLREQLLMYTIIERKIKNKILVNPGEITDYYYKNTKDFGIPEQREFDSINTENEDVAKQVLTKLKAGESLIDLAIAYALKVNKLSAQAGGELRKDIEDAVFSLKAGELSKPIMIDSSCYIFRLNNIILPKEQTFEEAKDSIYRFIFDKKMQEEMIKWLDELKKQSYIKIE